MSVKRLEKNQMIGAVAKALGLFGQTPRNQVKAAATARPNVPVRRVVRQVGMEARPPQSKASGSRRYPIDPAEPFEDIQHDGLHIPRECRSIRVWLLLATLLTAPALASRNILPPPETRATVDLERELQAPWQAGGEIVVYAAPDGSPRAGRRADPPVDASGEQARRAEHFALARKLNLVTAWRVVPFALPLTENQIALLERFALTDAGAVWFREMADDTLRLFNQGHLDYDVELWRGHLGGGPPPRLSALITGRLSEAGLFSQEVAVFRVFAFDGPGSQAAAASVRLGRQGFRCQFSMSGEAVDPFAILSHEFGHSRYGDPRSAGHPLGEARTVARYENPVRLRNGFPPRLVYYLRIEPGRQPVTRDPLFARVLAWREDKDLRLAELAPVEGLYCECPDAPGALRDCLGPRPDGVGACDLRWVAVRVEAAAP